MKHAVRFGVLALSVACVALLASAQASANPIPLSPGESATFNFDATSLIPFSGVAFFLQYADTDSQSDVVSILGDAGNAFSCGSVYPTNAALCDTFLAQVWTAPSLLDGIFSMTVFDFGSSNFSVDPYANIQLVTGEFVRVNATGPNGAPEPGSAVLIGLGLAALAASTRRKSQ